MNTFLKKHLMFSSALLFSACSASVSWSLEWTVGSWTEGEYAFETGEDELDQCGMKALLKEIESPLQYKLGPKNEDDTASSVFVGSSNELSDENIAIGTENLWDICSQPNDWNGPEFNCNFALLELHKPQWEPQLKAQFCPDSSVMSFRYNRTDGLLINANEIFLEHRLEVICNSELPSETTCESKFFSRLRPSTGN